LQGGLETKNGQLSGLKDCQGSKLSLGEIDARKKGRRKKKTGPFSLHNRECRREDWEKSLCLPSVKSSNTSNKTVYRGFQELGVLPTQKKNIQETGRGKEWVQPQ